MRNSEVIIKSFLKTPDGLGGYTEEFEEKKFYGRLFFAKDKQVVTRAYDLNTQIITNKYKLYLTTFYNDFNDLRSIKRGDRVRINDVDYHVYLIHAQNNFFLITLMEDFIVNENKDNTAKKHTR